MSDCGYIYVTDWDRFQHYKDRRPAWVKNYLDLLENEEYLELGAADRALLECIWKWTGLVGNGRVPAKPASLRKRFRLKFCNVERLCDAGFIEVRASKALAPRYQHASPEKEGSKEPIEEKSAASGASPNGSAAAHKKDITRALMVCRSATAGDTPELAAHTIRDLYPDMADRLIQTLSKERTTP